MLPELFDDDFFNELSDFEADDSFVVFFFFAADDVELEVDETVPLPAELPLPLPVPQDDTVKTSAKQTITAAAFFNCFFVRSFIMYLQYHNSFLFANMI